jgi:hypothetical protein
MVRSGSGQTVIFGHWHIMPVHLRKHNFCFASDGKMPLYRLKKLHIVIAVFASWGRMLPYHAAVLKDAKMMPLRLFGDLR